MTAKEIPPQNKPPLRDENGHYAEGHSGNPGGRPKRKEYTDAIRRQMNRPAEHEMGKKLPDSYTKLDKIAMALVDEAIKGNTVAIKEIGDRLDGKADASVSVKHSGEIAHPDRPVSDTFEFIEETLGRGSARAPEKPVLN